MTERGASRLERGPDHLSIGPSSVRWDGDAYVIDIDEWAFPVPRRIKGRIRVIPQTLFAHTTCLAPVGDHHWRPIAPFARIELDLTLPRLTWRGSAYFDTNSGCAPLEDGFARWDWSRAALADGSTVVFYDVIRRDRSCNSVSLQFHRDGRVTPIAAPPAVTLPTTSWRIKRGTHCDANAAAEEVSSLENGPFYSRSIIQTQVFGEVTRAVHESLSLDRFKARWVQALLPFRMPRALR
jgi:carotenoid 1,2-hydratase